MSYDAKPQLDDVVLTAWEGFERKGLGTYVHVAMYLSSGGNRGALVGEWSDEECERMFVDGVFKRDGVDGLRNSDATLARSVFEHAVQKNLGALAGFEKAILDAMAIAEPKLLGLHHDLSQEYGDDENFDAVMAAAGDALTSNPFPAVSDNRLHDMHEHLQQVLDDQLDAAAAPKP